MRPSVNIIRVQQFWGPRHERLLRLWRRAQNELGFDLHVTINHTLARHDDMLNHMWLKELGRPNRYAIFTEIDFLPGVNFALPPGVPVLAAQYATRNFKTMELKPQDVAGAWFVITDKNRVSDLDFTAPGFGTDPANGIDARLVPADDCWPEHYGIRVGLRGEHLFFSRFYDGSDFCPVPGLDVKDVLSRVDSRITAYENQWEV